MPTPSGSAAEPWQRMPTPLVWTEVERYRVYLGNVLITHGWITSDGVIWRHPQEGGESFSDCQAIARELGKLRAGLRAFRSTRPLRDVRDETYP